MNAKSFKQVVEEAKTSVERMNFFYCAKCKTFHMNFEIDRDELAIRDTWRNPRDFFGTPIQHIICPYCGYVLSGYMTLNVECTIDDLCSCMEYAKYTINLYSSVSRIVDAEFLNRKCKREMERKWKKLGDKDNEEIKRILKSMCKFDD